MNIEHLYYSGEISEKSNFYELLEIILYNTDFSITIKKLESFSITFPNFDKNVIKDLKNIFKNIDNDFNSGNELNIINKFLVGYNLNAKLIINKNDSSESNHFEYYDKLLIGLRRVIAYRFADKLNGTEEVKKNIISILKNEDSYDVISINNNSVIELYQDINGDLHFQKKNIRKIEKDLFNDNEGYFELDKEKKDIQSFNIWQYPVTFYQILLKYVIIKYKDIPEEISNLLEIDGVLPNATSDFNDLSIKLFVNDIKNKKNICNENIFGGNIQETLITVFNNNGITIYNNEEGYKRKLVFNISDNEIFSIIKSLHKSPGRSSLEILESYKILLEYYK